jgi:hypothetical protein
MNLSESGINLFSFSLIILKHSQDANGLENIGQVPGSERA